MDFLAKSTNLGNLEVVEIYVQYNGPRLLSCKNQANKIFLALWVDEEEDSDLWLYMLVSPERLQIIRTGQISLNQAFADSELNYLYELSFSYTDKRWSSKEVLVEEIDEDCFPSQDSFLNCEIKNLPQITSQRASWAAIEKIREVLHLVLEPSSEYPHEFPSLELGKVLSAFQLLVTQLKVVSGEALKLKLREIAKKSELNVFATSPGSFRVEFASSLLEVDAFGNSFAGDAIEELFKLIALGSNTVLLQDFMSRMDKQTPVKYRLFLQALLSSGTGLKLEWGSPTLTRGGSIEASLSSINEILAVIKKIESLQEKELEIVGELFKIDTDGWTFGIKDINNSYSYKGEILEQAKQIAGKATIGMLYSAKIIEAPEISPATNTIKTHYRLCSLNIYESPHRQMNIIELS